MQTLLGNLNLSVLATSSVKPRETTWLTGQWAEVKEVLALLQYLAGGGGEHRVWEQIALWLQMSISTALTEANLSLTTPLGKVACDSHK